MGVVREGTATLIAAGERVERFLRYTRDDIAAFAKLSLDANPLHLDAQAAQRARFGEIIASGQQTAACLMGLLATHFSRRDDGIAREVLCLNMNFSFKAPVFADQDLTLAWQVASAEWNGRLGGMLGHLDGHATVAHGRPAVIARGTILVTEAQG
jgi:acyl dehydratase